MTDLFEAFRKLKSTPLGQIADSLGFLCMAWSWLEREVDSLLLTLLHPADEKAAAAVIYNMDMRDKLKAALAAGFSKKPSDEWYSELRSIITEIDNDLRLERNRMVHDSWHHTGDEIFRLTTYVRVSYEQAKKLVIHFGEGKTITPADVDVLMFGIMAASGQIDDLIGRYRRQETPLPSPEKPA